MERTLIRPSPRITSFQLPKQKLEVEVDVQNWEKVPVEVSLGLDVYYSCILNTEFYKQCLSRCL